MICYKQLLHEGYRVKIAFRLMGSAEAELSEWLA